MRWTVSSALAACLCAAPVHAAETLFDRGGVTLERLRTATGYACDLTLRAEDGGAGLTPKFILGTDAAANGGLSTRAVWFLDVPQAVTGLSAKGEGESVSVKPGYRDLSFAKDRPAILDELLSRAALVLQGTASDGATLKANLNGAAFSDAFGLLRRDCDLDLSGLPRGLLQSAGGETWGLTADGAYKPLADVASVAPEVGPERDAPTDDDRPVSSYMACSAWPALGAEGTPSTLSRLLVVAEGASVDGFIYKGGTKKGRFEFPALAATIRAEDGASVRAVLPVRSMIPKAVRFVAPKGETVRFVSEDGSVQEVTSGFVRAQNIEDWTAATSVALDLSCLNTADGMTPGDAVADAGDNPGNPKTDGPDLAKLDPTKDPVAPDRDGEGRAADDRKDGPRLSVWGTPDTAPERPKNTPGDVTGAIKTVCEVTPGSDGLTVIERGAMALTGNVKAVLAGHRSEQPNVEVVWGEPVAAAERPTLSFDLSASTGQVLPYRPLPTIGDVRPVVIDGLDSALRQGDLPVLRIAVFADEADLTRVDFAAIQAAFDGIGERFALDAVLYRWAVQADGSFRFVPSQDGGGLADLSVDLGPGNAIPGADGQFPLMLASIGEILANAQRGGVETRIDHVVWVKGDWTVSSSGAMIMEGFLGANATAAGDGKAPWLTMIAGHPGNRTNGYLGIPLSMSAGIGRMIEEADPSAKPRRYIADAPQLAKQIQAAFETANDIGPTIAKPKRLMANAAEVFQTTGILVSYEALESLSFNALDWGVRLARAKSGSDAMGAYAGQPSAHRFGLMDVLTQDGATVLASTEVTPDWMRKPIADMTRRDLKGLRADLSRFATLMTDAELAAGDQACAYVYIPLNADYSGLGAAAK